MDGTGLPSTVRWFWAELDLRAAGRAHDDAFARVWNFQTRARDLVLAGRDVSGWPALGEPTHVGATLRRSRRTKEWEAVVPVLGGDGRPVRFPARWLDMPADEWRAELRALCEARDKAAGWAPAGFGIAFPTYEQAARFAEVLRDVGGLYQTRVRRRRDPGALPYEVEWRYVERSDLLRGTDGPAAPDAVDGGAA